MNLDDKIRRAEFDLRLLDGTIAQLQEKAAPLRNRLSELYAERYIRDSINTSPEKEKRVKKARKVTRHRQREATAMQNRWIRQH